MLPKSFRRAVKKPRFFCPLDLMISDLKRYAGER